MKMKKLFLIIGLGVGMMVNKVDGQITYEHTYPAINSNIWARPIIINMGNNDYKYFYIDYLSNQIKLFNLDHTPYFFVNVPITISYSDYTIGYVTKSLFDCDTNMFEYAILPVNWRKNFYIYRQDGTLLFQRDSTIAIYCLGCYNGVYDIRPIYNTPEGAKLFLAKEDSNGFVKTEDVYSLCGTLPTNEFDFTNLNQSFVKIFPNPTSGTLSFEINPPDNMNEYELVIVDNNAREIKREKVGFGNRNYTMDVRDFSGGTYFYSLCTKNKSYQSGKFILNK
jgi:hypothetical protein